MIDQKFLPGTKASCSRLCGTKHSFNTQFVQGYCLRVCLDTPCMHAHNNLIRDVMLRTWMCWMHLLGKLQSPKVFVRNLIILICGIYMFSFKKTGVIGFPSSPCHPGSQGARGSVAKHLLRC